VVNFVVFGVVVLTTVAVWRTVLAGGCGSAAVPVFTALSGMSLVACGLIPQDPAPGYDPAGLALTAPTLPGLIHLAAAAVGAAGSIGSLAILAARFRGDPLWRGWAAYSVIIAVVMITCIAVYAFWSTSATGFAGLFERIALSMGPLWLLTFLVRLESGTPFMIVPRASGHRLLPP
jgi:hypothetical protein